MVADSFVLNASFSRTVILIVHVRMRRGVGVGDRLEIALAGFAGGDVPPVDRHRCARGGRGRGGARGGCAGRRCGARGSCAWCRCRSCGSRCGGGRRRSRRPTAARTRIEQQGDCPDHRQRSPARCHDSTSSAVPWSTCAWMRVSVSCDPVSTRPPFRSGVTGATASSVESFEMFSETAPRPAHDTGRRSGRQDPTAGNRRARRFVARYARKFRYAPRMPTPDTPVASRRTHGSSTIADIAARTGVSVPTVSKVINGRSDVAPDTRRRVEAAIREVGYQRPSRAGSRAPLLEVIFHELESRSGRWRSSAASSGSPDGTSWP